MKKLIALAALAFAGCSSMTEISKISTAAKTDDGAAPIASVSVKNVSYSLFGCLPIASGCTWKGECPYAQRPSRNTVWFENLCTPDENLASMKAALKELGSDKVMNLVERSESESLWSLWIIRQSIETTSCTVLAK